MRRPNAAKNSLIFIQPNLGVGTEVSANSRNLISILHALASEDAPFQLDGCMPIYIHNLFGRQFTFELLEKPGTIPTQKGRIYPGRKLDLPLNELKNFVLQGSFELDCNAFKEVPAAWEGVHIHVNCQARRPVFQSFARCNSLFGQRHRATKLHRECIMSMHLRHIYLTSQIASCYQRGSHGEQTSDEGLKVVDERPPTILARTGAPCWAIAEQNWKHYSSGNSYCECILEWLAKTPHRKVSTTRATTMNVVAFTRNPGVARRRSTSAKPQASTITAGGAARG